MLAHEPLEAEAVADLLVGRGDEDEVAAPAPALARERCASATALAATWPFMSSAPRPQTNPSRSSPPNGSALHSRASAGTTSVCESSASDGPPPRAAQARDEVRPLGHLRVQLALDARRPRGSARSSSAAAVSLPGGFDVSTRISSRRSSTASSLSAASRASAGSGAARRPARPCGSPRRARRTRGGTPPRRRVVELREQRHHGRRRRRDELPQLLARVGLDPEAAVVELELEVLGRASARRAPRGPTPTTRGRRAARR